MKTPAEIKAINKFNKANTKIYPVRLNFNTDKDIIEKLESVESKQGYIKELIRKDISRPE